MARKTVDKWKSKKTFEITAPELFNNAVIGETFADDPNKITGRVLKVDYSDVTDSKGSRSRVKLNFKIDAIHGNTASTKFLGHNIAPDFERSLSRKGTSKVYINKKITTKENTSLNVKVFAISASQIKKTKQKAIRAKLIEVIEKSAKETSFEKLLNDIFTNRFGKDIKKELSKIYPIKYVIVQKTELLNN